MSQIIAINSNSHFKSVLASTVYLVVDFYADWCGPCKQIAPVFDQLAAAESRSGKLAFCKVDVDAHSDIAGAYGVSASVAPFPFLAVSSRLTLHCSMPTFLVLKGTSVIETIRGANPTALRTAVLSAAANAAKGPAKSTASFQGKGQKIGSTSSMDSRSRSVGAPSLDVRALIASPAAFSQGPGWASAVIRFVGLYLTTLLSLEPAKAAEESAFAARSPSGRTMR